MKVRCPGCRTSLQVPDDKRGRTGRCPKCGASVPIVPADEEGTYGFSEPPPAPAPTPAGAAAAAPAPAAASAAREAAAAVQDVPEAPPKKKKKKKKRAGWRQYLELERLEKLTGAQWVLAACGGIVALGLVLALIGLVLTPVLDAVLDTIYSAPAPAVLAADKWSSFPFGEGASILLPGAPQSELVLASTVPMNVFGSKPQEDVLFAVAVNRDPLPAEKLKMTRDEMLNDFVDGFRARIRAMEGDEVARKAIEHEGHSGVQMDSRIRAIRAKFVHRAFFAGGRVYVVFAGGRGYKPGHPNLTRFLDSLKLPAASR